MEPSLCLHLQSKVSSQAKRNICNANTYSRHVCRRHTILTQSCLGHLVYQIMIHYCTKSDVHIEMCNKQPTETYTKPVHVLSLRETKTFLEIVKGTCFFLYCPFLPIWWILEFTITIIRNKQRVKKRKQQYRKKKIEEKLDGTEFLSIDDYSKGRKEKKKFKSVKEKLGKRSNDTVLSHLE